jgi:hypothetical protein
MKILFHENQLCLRGTSVAMFDYAHFNEEILSNESYVLFDHNSRFNDNQAIDKFCNRFKGRVFSYRDKSEINRICDHLNIDCFYMIKSGENDGLLSNKKNLVHAVFQANQPHGDVYAYVSEWLSRKMSNGTHPYVPHIVHLPPPTENVRDAMGVPKDAFVFGRYGGYDQFDIQFVKDAIVEFVQNNSSVWFVFFNTAPFVNHERIKFFNGFADMQLKANVVESCDAMIHARSMGESFGLAICEFLYGNKPVLAWNGGNDRHHIDILEKRDLLYTTKEDLIDKMANLVSSTCTENHRTLVEKFSPSMVMDRFNRVFLQG